MARAKSSRVGRPVNGKHSLKGESKSDVEGATNGSPAGNPLPVEDPPRRDVPGPSLGALTDTYLARWFVDKKWDVIRYSPTSRSWLIWGGSCWRNDDRNQALSWARDSIHSLIEQLPRAEGRLEQEEYEKTVQRLESSRTLATVIKMAESDSRIIVTPDPWDKLSKCVPIAYAEKAKCPTWDKFLQEVTGGNEDLIAYLRRAAGYALTGDVREQCLFLFYGTGRNGKSVFLNTLLHVLGDYGMSASNHLLTSAGRPQKQTDLAGLAGKRLVVVCEPNGGRLDESLVKWLTGGEKIRARRPRGEDFEFQPTHKFFMASNHKPEIRETGEAMWRRIRLIPFSVTIPLEKENKRLPAQLQDRFWTVEPRLLT
jgi:putative DNA primase/helicase